MGAGCSASYPVGTYMMLKNMTQRWDLIFSVMIFYASTYYAFTRSIAFKWCLENKETTHKQTRTGKYYPYHRKGLKIPLIRLLKAAPRYHRRGLEPALPLGPHRTLAALCGKRSFIWSADSSLTNASWILYTRNEGHAPCGGVSPIGSSAFSRLSCSALSITWHSAMMGHKFVSDIDA